MVSSNRPDLLRLGVATKRLGLHPTTLRGWANDGKVEYLWVGRERRFPVDALDRLSGVSPVESTTAVAGYVRVSGTTGQESSLAAQEAELRGRFGDRLTKVYKDKASGLRERRPGLNRLLRDAESHCFSVVAVTHSDRLARFGVSWLEALLGKSGVTVEVLHPKGSTGGMPELLDDFMTLVATFAGRMYGIRSAETKKRLLASAEEKIDEAA